MTLAFDCKTTHVPSLSHITLAHDQTAISPNVQLSLCRRVETNEWAEDRQKVPLQLLPQMLVLLALPSSYYFYSAAYSLWESEVSNYLKAPNFLNQTQSEFVNRPRYIKWNDLYAMLRSHPPVHSFLAHVLRVFSKVWEKTLMTSSGLFPLELRLERCKSFLLLHHNLGHGI